jgi:hypothetical protein
MLTYALGCIFLHCTFPIGLSGTSPNWVVHGMKETWSCCCTSAVFNQGRFDYKRFKNYIWRELRDIYNGFTFTISSEVYALWKPYISELKIWQNWMKLQEKRFVYIDPSYLPYVSRGDTYTLIMKRYSWHFEWMLD